MRLFPTTSGGWIAFAVPDEKWPAPVPEGLGTPAYVEETDATEDELKALRRTITPRPRRPGMPPAPRLYRFDGTNLRRSDDTVWTPATTAERTDWDAQLQNMIDRAAQIRDTVQGQTLAQTQTAVRDIAIGVRRILLYIRWFRNGT